MRDKTTISYSAVFGLEISRGQRTKTTTEATEVVLLCVLLFFVCISRPICRYLNVVKKRVSPYKVCECIASSVRGCHGN